MQERDGVTPLTPEKIKRRWEQIGLYARNSGTWMHYNIERFLNGLPANMTSIELQQFLKFYQDQISAPGIIPYRTEWLIAAPDLSLGGCVDFIGKLPNGKYILIDWKRSKTLMDNLENKYKKAL